MEKLRPNEQRSRLAILFVWIAFAIEMASLISGYFQYDLLKSIQNGGAVTIEEANANDNRELIIAILNMIVFIISAITFIRWFRRAYYNLHQLVSSLSHTEGWAAGAWFVPIVSLYLPYQIMKELYKKTKHLLLQSNSDMPVYLSITSVGIWWTLWIIQNIIGQVAFRVTMNAETIDGYILGSLFNIVSSILFIPLTLVTIKVIKDYAAVEPLLQKVVTEENCSEQIEIG